MQPLLTNPLSYPVTITSHYSHYYYLATKSVSLHNYPLIYGFDLLDTLQIRLMLRVSTYITIITCHLKI
ncbi:hypothetical protein HDC91_003574 [Mucilaginibacter sp. AK015]|nr:hypothetical protein [Mucilaginibacter sp. AK015]